MSTDSYTRLMLTIIALCLVWLAVGGAKLFVVQAQSEGGVVITGWADRGGTVHRFPRPIEIERANESGAGFPVKESQ